MLFFYCLPAILRAARLGWPRKAYVIGIFFVLRKLILPTLAFLLFWSAPHRCTASRAPSPPRPASVVLLQGLCCLPFLRHFGRTARLLTLLSTFLRTCCLADLL